MALETNDRLYLLPEIARRILSVSQPLRIILFCSYARGDYGPNSDLDLLVVLEKVTSTRTESIWLRRVLRGLLPPIDILVATPEQLEKHRKSIGLIYQPVLEEGKVIYERATSN
jgi:predicted nucleotidyltransferase